MCKLYFVVIISMLLMLMQVLLCGKNGVNLGLSHCNNFANMPQICKVLINGNVLIQSANSRRYLDFPFSVFLNQIYGVSL